ncbi:threonine aldolase family protein [Undibacterium sp. Di27W]|uniref:threonine aldolase family protein n=1 Tax=Undibacterium sp. Di27W TaxID=3413036 RepID=UPI003BF0D0F4
MKRIRIVESKHITSPPTIARNFASDNTAAVSPAIMEAMLAANTGRAAAYGADDYTARVEKTLCEIFERELSVFLVSTGTAANSLCLSAMSPPWGHIFCHPGSHIHNDECAAPEFYTHGAKLLPIDGPSAKIDVNTLASSARLKRGDVHVTQPHAVSITQATEIGSVYSIDEIKRISEVCQSTSMRLHMDGSRFANALVSLACTPAEMTWKAGVDALSFGATKNGAMGVEAIILFDQSLAAEMGYRRKRAAHLTSKMRYLSVQMEAYLQDDLWLKNAAHANDMALRLRQGLQQISGIEVLGETQANIIFCRLPEAMIAALLKQGYAFLHGRWEAGVARFVTSFATTVAEIEQLLASMRDMLTQQAAERAA